MKSVNVILVTYNRCEYLVKCIAGLNVQTYPIKNILIVDNDSTDGTKEMIQNMMEENEKLSYVNTGSNLGGAGGFSFGLDHYIKNGDSDLVWVMDDDVLPSASCLENMIKHVGGKNICQPVRRYHDSTFVKSEAKEVNLSNPLKELKSVFYLEKDTSKELTEIKCFPFEGPLFTRDMIIELGLPRKDFFIMADDTEYSFRALNLGYKINMVSEAVLYRQIKPIKNALDSNLTWKSYFYIRNLNIIDIKYGTNGVKYIRPVVRLARYLYTSAKYKRNIRSYKIAITSFMDSYRSKLNNDLDRWK